MWLMISVAGGVALILFGVRFLRKALDRLIGNQLGPVLRRLAGTRMRSFFAGIGASIMMPSSTTMSVLAVQTVRDGHLPPRRVLPLMLGADIGLTAMVLLISMRMDRLAPGFLAVGVVLFQFARNRRSRGLGQLLLSLGFIFLGISMISQAAGRIEPGGDLVEILTIATRYPLLLVGIAALLALLLQSSTATIGLALGLGAADLGGVDPLHLAVPIVLGANIGVSLTLVLISWSSLEGRRLGLGNLLFKVTTAALILLLLGPVYAGLEQVPAAFERRVALTHSGSNILMAIIFLPLIIPVFRLIEHLVPDSHVASPPAFAPLYINNRHIEGPALATGQSRQEVLRVSALVRAMLDDLWQALTQRSAKLAQAVQQRDDQVDLLDHQIKRYLARVAGEDADAAIASEVMSQLNYLHELETIGDVIDKNLAELVVKRAEKDVWFSDSGWSELDGFYRKVAENMLIAETAFAGRDRALAQQLLRHKQALNAEELRLRDNHFQRLRAGQTQSHESSAVHLDILTHLKRINSCVTHVAYGIVEDAGGDTSDACDLD